MANQKKDSKTFHSNPNYKQGLSHIKRTAKTTGEFDKPDPIGYPLLLQALIDYNDASRRAFESGTHGYVEFAREIAKPMRQALDVIGTERAKTLELTLKPWILKNPADPKRAIAEAFKAGDLSKFRADQLIGHYEELKKLTDYDDLPPPAAGAPPIKRGLGILDHIKKRFLDLLKPSSGDKTP
jgi:hypothetical protein